MNTREMVYEELNEFLLLKCRRSFGDVHTRIEYPFEFGFLENFTPYVAVLVGDVEEIFNLPRSVAVPKGVSRCEKTGDDAQRL